MAPSCAGCCWSIGSHGVGVWIVDGNENSSARNDFDLAGGQQQQPQGDCQSVFGFNRGAATSSSSFLNISDLCIDLSVQMAGRPLKTVDEATTNEHRVHNRIQVYGGGLQI